MDIDPELADLAASNLSNAGITEVTVRGADGWSGYPDRAPYDAIIATMACWAVSPAWLRQLRLGGRFVAPLWFGPGFEAVAAMRMTRHGLEGRLLEPCSFTKPRGDAGGPRLTIRDPRAPDRVVNVSAQLGSDLATLRRAQEIIATEPEYAEVGELGPSWFRRVALADPGAFVVRHDQGNSWMTATGITDPAIGSGAWLETHYRRDPAYPNSVIIDEEKWAYVGAIDTLTRLQQYSIEPHDIKFADLELQISAPQTPTPTEEPPHWELHRRGLVLRLWNRQ